MTEQQNPFHDASSVEELLGLLAGAASICWEHPDRAGQFQSSTARAFVGMAQEKLVDLMGVREAKREAWWEGYRAGGRDAAEDKWFEGETRPCPYEDAETEHLHLDAFHRLDTVWDFDSEVAVQTWPVGVSMKHRPTGFVAVVDRPGDVSDLYQQAKEQLGSMLTSWRGSR